MTEINIVQSHRPTVREKISFIQRYIKDNPPQHNQLTGEPLTQKKIEEKINSIPEKTEDTIQNMYLYYLKMYKGTYDFYENKKREKLSKYRIVGKLDKWKLQRRFFSVWFTIDKFSSEIGAEIRLINILTPERELLFDRFGNKL